MVFPGTEVSLTGHLFTGCSFVPFSEICVMFPLLQSPRTSPDCHDFKYHGEWLGKHITHFPQDSGMHLIRSCVFSSSGGHEHVGGKWGECLSEDKSQPLFNKQLSN